MQFALENFGKKDNYFNAAITLLQTTKMGDGAIAASIGCHVKTVRRAKQYLRNQGILPQYQAPKKVTVEPSIFSRALKAMTISDDQERRQHNEDNDESN